MTEPLHNAAAEIPAATASPGPAGEQQNPTVAFERRDVNIRAIVGFAIGLSAMIGIVLLVIGVLYSRFENAARARKPEFPMAAAIRRNLRETAPDKLLPPPPRLDGVVPVAPGQPAGRILPAFEQPDVWNARFFYDAQERILNSWQWVDKDHTIARIPIAEAMSRLSAKPGDVLKARPARTPSGRDETADQPSASNSGRGSIGGQK
jgi:hypothetical protein